MRNRRRLGRNLAIPPVMRLRWRYRVASLAPSHSTHPHPRMSTDTPRATARPTDEQLMARVTAGDRAALEALHARYRPPALRVAAGVVGPDHADDVVQEAFLAVWRRSGQFDAARGDVRVWLKGLVRNRAVDSVRKLEAERRRRDLAEQQGERDLPRDPTLDLVEGSEEALLLRHAIEGLPRDQYRVLDLAYYLGLSQTAIARVLGCPVGTVKGRARLGLMRLRETLDTPA